MANQNLDLLDNDQFLEALLSPETDIASTDTQPVGETGESVTVPRPGRMPQQQNVEDEASLRSNGMWNWTPDKIAEWSINSEGKFSPKQFATAHPDFVRNNPDVAQKLADAHGVLADRGIVDKLGDIDWAQAAMGVGHLIKGAATASKAYGEQFSRRGAGIPFISQGSAGIAAATEAVTKGKGNAIVRALEAALPRPLFKKLWKDDPETQQQLGTFLQQVDDEQLQKQAEIIAGSETGATGFIDMLRRGGRNVASMVNIADKWGELSPEERAKRFSMDTAVQQQLAKGTTGEGAATEAIFGGKAKEIVDPEQVELLSAGDPMALIGFGALFRGLPGGVGYALSKTPAARQLARATAAAGEAATARGAAANAARIAAGQEAAAGRAAVGAFEAGTPEAIAQAERAATQAGLSRGAARVATAVEGRAARGAQAAEAAVGPTARAARGASRAVGSVIDRASRAADAIGRGAGRGVAGAGLWSAGAGVGATSAVADFISSFVPPIALPRAVRRGIELGYRGGRAMRRTGRALTRQQPEELGLFGQFISDVTASMGETGVAAVKGLPIDLALGGIIADDPAEMRGVPLFMASIGALRGAGRGVRRTIGGQLVAPRNARMQGTEFQATARRNSGTFPSLDQANQYSLRGQAPEVVQRFGAIRSFVEQFGGEAFFISDPVVARDALMAAGLDEVMASRVSQQLGGMVQLRDRNGNVRNIAVINELAAGPHEGGHVLQMVMPVEQVEFLRREARRNYGRTWEQDGRRYTNDLLRRDGPEGTEGRELSPGEDWRAALVEATGGASEGRLRGRTIEEMGDAILADEYIAENIDAAVKARGPNLGGSRLQDWVSQALIRLGAGDMPIGRSEVQGVDVTPRSFEVARGAARTTAREFGRPRFGGEGEPLRRGAPVRPADVEPIEGEPPATGGAPIEPIEPPEGPGGGAGPGPRLGDSIQTARNIADQLRNNGQRREAAIMDEVADAIAADEGVLVDYAAARGTGAADPAVLRNVRRAEIELGRMPGAIRNQIQHMLFPFRVVNTRTRGPQVIGWSPTVYLANAQRLASTLADLSHRGVDIRQFSPYEIDVRNRTFTEAGWQQLMADAEQFSRNQLAGATGAGEQLVIPRSAEAMGAFPPEVRPERVGTEQPLQQNVADFHNLLFNFRLPNTPRISRRGGAPLNIVGQEVSAATQPGRLSVPVEPRGQYLGDRAQQLGIEGRDIMEVNPLRAEIEQAARDHGLNYPSMIETIQRLNLEHIADTTPAPGVAGYGRGNTLTLSAGFQAKRKGAGGQTYEAMRETPRVGYGKHVWLDKDGNYFDANGYHKEWAERYTGLKGDAAMQKLLDEGWIRVNATPGIGIFAENKPGEAFKTPQVKALEDFAFNAELPVLNRKGRVQINSTADFMKNGSVFFQAAKRKGGTKDFALKPSRGGERMSKAWILPNGEPVQLGGEWHHQFLGRSAADMAARFKMDPKALKGGETKSRVEALKKGAVRINYNSGTGNLTIEATREGWKRNKAALEMFALENIDKIDSVDIAIFDKNVRKEVDYDSAQIFRYEGAEKLQNFPMLFDDMRSSAAGSARETIAGLFQPAKRTDVESIRAAAVRWKPTGESFEGIMHALATEALLQKGIADDLIGRKVRSFDELSGEEWNKLVEQIDDGYTTSNNRFVTRDEAVDIGDQAGQLDTRAKAKIQMRKEVFGVKGLDSMEVSDLREQQIAAEAGGKVSGETIGRAHGDPTLEAQPEQTKPRNLATIKRAAKEGKLDDIRNEALREHLEGIKVGRIEGVTMDRRGAMFDEYDGKPYDVVTLHSQNFPVDTITPEQVAKIMSDWRDVLALPDTTAGLFTFEQGGKDMVSVDINAVVPKKHRANTLDFLKKNDQIAGFDLEKFDVFEAGGTGQNPRITTPGQAISAVKALQEGRDPFAVDKAPEQGTFAAQPGRQRELEGIPKGVSIKPVRDVELHPEKALDASLPTAAEGPGKRKQSTSHRVSLVGKLDGPDKTTPQKRWNGYVKKVVDKVNEIPGFRDVKGTVKQRYEEMVRRAADNLKYLYEISPEADRKLHSQWYWFANSMSKRWGSEFGHEPHAVSALNSILSPQKDWYENVSATRYVLESMKQDYTLKPEHIAFAREVINRRKSKLDRQKGHEIIDAAEKQLGKKLSELDSDAAAIAIRGESELFTDKSIHDHELLPIDKTEGGRSAFDWQKYDVVARAIDALRNPTLENINLRLGEKHKVRSFYNNHVDPQNRTALPVTVDTHAVAAASLIPFGAASPEVKANFGNPNASGQGYFGTYPFWADAYRLAAKELGIEFPAELQSITWERIRRVVNPGKKRSLQKVVKDSKGRTVDIRFPAIEELWTKVEQGKLTRREAQEQIVALLSEPTKAQAKKEAGLARNQLQFKLED